MICKSKSSRSLFDYFFIKTNGMRPSNVKKNYKELRYIGNEHGKTIKQLPMSENVIAEVYQYIMNHELYHINKKLENEYLIDMQKYVYKITKDQTFKKNIERIK